MDTQIGLMNPKSGTRVFTIIKLQNAGCQVEGL